MGLHLVIQEVVLASHLSLSEREHIALGLGGGKSYRRLAQELGRAVSTISREVGRHGGRASYDARRAANRARRLRRRPKQRKLLCHPKLAQAVTRKLVKKWSPEQISRWLRDKRRRYPEWFVSHETIYQSLYVQGRGGLRQELTDALRTGRARRRSQGRSETKGRIQHMVMISERPATIEDRAVPGHWEGDLILGKDSKSQIGTLVERQTRFVMLCHLPADRRAETVRRAIQAKIRSLPKTLKRSLTWDQGKEMSEHTLLKMATGMQIFFCDPRSPWQRGSNENTNGLLRQYFPKGTDLSTISARKLNAVARELNERPRKTLNWMTPAEKFNELLQTVALTT